MNQKLHNPYDEVNKKDISGDWVVDSPVIWSSPEHLNAPKSKIWYFAMILFTITVVVLDVMFLKSYTLSGVIVVSAIAIFVYFRQPAKENQYNLSQNKGLYVNNVLHPFEDFRSFGIVSEENYYALVMTPTKRFGQSLHVYFPEQLGEVIVDIMGSQIPMQEVKSNFIDTIVKRLGL